jgi:hypothetical protein
MIVRGIGVLTSILGIFAVSPRGHRPQRHEGDQPGLLHLGRGVRRTGRRGGVHVPADQLRRARHRPATPAAGSAATRR